MADRLAFRGYSLKNKLGDRMIKRLLNSVIANIVICHSLVDQFRIRHGRWIARGHWRPIYTGLASTSIKIFTNTGKKVPKFEYSCTRVFLSGTCADIYIRLRLTPYKWVLNAFVQRPRQIQNWTVICLSLRLRARHWQTTIFCLTVSNNC